ncbi:tetratricopeptide repeat protein [Roseisolibacter agri]|nr:YMGG-like glycine zipper-containing protein [Roseisolibacter agri]
MSALVLLAALAACSTGDATTDAAPLAKDSALVARLAPAPVRPALPEVCGAVPAAAQPAAASMSRAEDLAHRAYAAEALGDPEAARALLRRASDLDGTNESAVYHLGRVTEALGDRPAAVAAYCRFLALTPTAAEADEARQRVARLSQPETHVATASEREPAATARARAKASRRGTRARAAVARTVAHRTVEAAPAPPAATTDAAVAHGVADTVSSGEVVATTSAPEPIGQPATTARTSGGGPSRAQRAGIGAAAGAIIGAVTGRSVKGALIGAAAGGIVGTATGGGRAGRGIRSSMRPTA